MKAKLKGALFSRGQSATTQKKMQYITIFVFSLLFSAGCIMPSARTQGFWFAAAASLIGSLPISLLVAALLKGLNILRSKLTTSEYLGFSFKAFIVPCIILIGWWVLTAFLTCYPAIATEDTEDIFRMIWGMPFESDHFRYDSLNNHHPAFYIFLISIPLNTATWLGLSQPIAVSVVALFHLITLAICCSLFLSKLWVISKSRLFWLLSFCFFTLNPLIILYSVTIWKDVIFAGFFLVFLVEFFALISTRRSFFTSQSDVIALLVSTLFCLLTRNNAIVVIAVTAIVALIVIKDARRPIAALFVSALVITGLVVGPLYSALGIKSGHFAESISVPLQQVASVAASDDATMSESQHDYLNELLPFEQYKEKYDPLSANPIKFSHEFDDGFLESDKVAFVQTWLELGIENPKIYLNAWVEQTRAFWNPESETWYIAKPGYQLDEESRVQHNLMDGIMSYYHLTTLLFSAMAVFSPIYSPSLLAWFALLAFVLLFCRKNKTACLYLLPLVLWWVTLLIAAPATDFRYMFPVHLALPFIFTALLYSGREKHSH